MSAQSIKSFAQKIGFSDEAVSAILAHLNDYAEDNNLTVLKKTNHVVTFSYENKIRCKFSSVETAKEQVVFIPGDGYVSTIVVAIKLNSVPTQKETIMTKTNTVPTAEQTKVAANNLVTTLAKTATYLSAATAIGIGGYYLWKKFGNKAE